MGKHKKSIFYIFSILYRRFSMYFAKNLEKNKKETRKLRVSSVWYTVSSFICRLRLNVVRDGYRSRRNISRPRRHGWC